MIAGLRSSGAWWVLGLLGATVVGSSLVSCANDPFDPESLDNTPPQARIFVGGSGGELQATSYNGATFHWSGTDNDGLVVGFHVSIAPDGEAPTDWIFTTRDETTATYATDINGEAVPRLWVVAEDNRGALSDTVSTAFPLVNFPPVLEFAVDFDPVAQSFSAATFELFGFDLDGDETLLPVVDYRFEGSDPSILQESGEPGADPSVGWVRRPRDRRRFNLDLRGVPAGDPDDEFRQTVYVRLVDEAGATSDFSYTWQVFEVRGEVLLIDDNAIAAGRDQFYIDVMNAHLGDAWNLFAATSLPTDPDDQWLTLSPFRTIVWYSQPVSPSPRLAAAQDVLTRFITADLDPETPGLQQGRLYLEYQLAGATTGGLSTAFKTGVLHVGGTPFPRNQIVRVSEVAAAIGPTLEINSQDPSLPDLVHDPLTASGTYFGLWGMSLGADAVPLWNFEQAEWGGRSDPTCRIPGCEPTVALRWPVNGLARVVTVAFQIDYADASGNAREAVRAILRDHLGVADVGGQ